MYVEIAEAALVVYDQRKRLGKLLKKYWRRMLYGHTSILVFGPGGTGKTTLGGLLSGKFDPYTGARKYRKSLDTENYSICGYPCTILVPPGQTRRRVQTWPQLYDKFLSGKKTIVVNVVSYGYHSIPELSYRELPTYKNGQTPRQFLQQYRTQCIKDEVEVLKELAMHLQYAKLHKRNAKIHMITVVLKQDLWWHARRAVRRLYEGNAYASEIAAIANAVGAANFVHDYLSCSLVISNFVTDKGEVLAETASGYDQGIQAVNLNALVERIHQLME